MPDIILALLEKGIAIHSEIKGKMRNALTFNCEYQNFEACKMLIEGFGAAPNTYVWSTKIICKPNFDGIEIQQKIPFCSSTLGIAWAMSKELKLPLYLLAQDNIAFTRSLLENFIKEEYPFILDSHPATHRPYLKTFK